MSRLDYPTAQPLLKYKLHLKFTGENKKVNITLSDVPRKPDGSMYSKCIINMDKMNVSNLVISSTASKTFFLKCNLINQQSFDNSTNDKKMNIIHSTNVALTSGQTIYQTLSPFTRGEFSFLTQVPYSGSIDFKIEDDQGNSIAPYDLNTTRFDVFLNMELID